MGRTVWEAPAVDDPLYQNLLHAVHGLAVLLALPSPRPRTLLVHVATRCHGEVVPRRHALQLSDGLAIEDDAGVLAVR